jgi:hypothetical protein
MTVFDANITPAVLSFLEDELKQTDSFEAANQIVYNRFGIIDFFVNNDELFELKSSLSIQNHTACNSERAEYGDFQTNQNLAYDAARLVYEKNGCPDVIIEPTCGKGNFIIASLRNFQNVKNIYGIEIYKPYIWECKFNIIDFYLNHPDTHKAGISIIHDNVFDFDFRQIKQNHINENILIIGNPPWVTNSMLGSLNSKNLPRKTNFKNHTGIEAITGKGNFDIAEYIATSLLEMFQETNARLVLLVKNSVIKNILLEQSKNRYRMSEMEKYLIDSKKEFNVSVEASLFCCTLNSEPEFDCTEFDFYASSKKIIKKFGWVNQKFVSNTKTYLHTYKIDGICPFVWRQGLKHDCTSVMELEKISGGYRNALKEEFPLEPELVYGLLKSSDLKNTVADSPRRFTIVTQQNIGQETNSIKHAYPETYQYLFQHKTYFDARKSSIYNNKPLFSIFGIGDYSFAPYKVAISGLYKTFHFTLVLPSGNSPVMLDDTCYFVGFNNLEYAVYTLILLNSNETASFLQSVTFPDAKRTFTKDVLMRIGLYELATALDADYLQNELNKFNETYGFNVKLDLWDKFFTEIKPAKKRQMELKFA